MFPTPRGRGVHHQRAHKDWYDARLQVSKDHVRWTEEETAMMARREAELTQQGPVRFMNMDLLRFFPQRTVEAIKGHRRRQDYKDLVAKYRAEDQRPPSPNIPEEGEPVDETFLELLESLPYPRCHGFQAEKIHNIAMEARLKGKTVTLQRLALYIREIFPPPEPRRRPPRQPKPNLIPSNSRSKRRQQYATTQILWRKDRKRCIGNVLDNLNNYAQPPQEIMEPFWTEILRSAADSSPSLGITDSIDRVWCPIQERELGWGRIERTTAAGPDGISARLFRSVPGEIVLRIFNLLLWCRRLPEDLLLSRTIFLPKKAEARTPGDFRPITIPSIIVRSLHKILAKRLNENFILDERQRAFRSTDGCADNTFLLDTMLRFHRRKFKPLYVAALDVSKAFDSISHPAIREVAKGIGLTQPMIEYLMHVYENSKTKLIGDNWISPPIHPRRGVRQGDPLSPIIFNAVTHELLKRLPEEIGAKLGEKTVNAIAYADDLILFASTTVGLQQLIDKTTEFLGSCGMSINPAKSFTVSIKASAHAKKTAVDPQIRFTCAGQRLPSMARSDNWRYLGVTFTPEGRTVCRPVEIVKPLLESLSKAPLKPQQRLYALRTHVLPRLYHQLALGAVTIGTLNKIDKISRRFVRQWLNLPHDVPAAYFHAAVRDGGLGIPAVRWIAPFLRRGRIMAASRTFFQHEAENFSNEELAKCTRRLFDQGTLLNTGELISKRWSEKLYASIDGAGLQESGCTAHQHQWVADGNKFLTGRDFINCIKARINALPTASRTARGRTKDRRCRAGCAAQETLNHVLQHCHRTHGGRVKRHDAVLAYLQRRIKRSGYTVHTEPHIPTAVGIRKPDIVAILGHTGIIVDAQVVSEQTDLYQAHRRKVQYYEEPSLTEKIKTTYGVTNVIVASVTLSWKGVWGAASASQLKLLGFVTNNDLKIISTRVLIGDIAQFRTFNAVTTMHWRTGIG